MILVHELGHFWAGRGCGLKVQSFGIGLGPKIASHKAKDGVTYVLRILPLGGYCRFYGEDESVDDEAFALYLQAKWKRAVMTVSGPLMNFAVAVLALFVLYAVIGVFISIPTIRTVESGSPAEEAGLLAGDRFHEVNGIAIQNTSDIQQMIQASPDQPIELTIERNRAYQNITVVPRIMDEASTQPRIGISFASAKYRLSWGISAKYAFIDTGRLISVMVDFLRNLVTRGEGISDMAGPIGAVQVIKEETQTNGLPAYFSMGAFIGVNLGLFNLLPIPGLDGSRLLFLLVEAIRRKRMDPNREGLIHLIGIGLLLLLMLPVYVRDVAKLFQ